MSIKAIGIAIKLTMEGWSQVAHFQTWVFVMVAISCIIIQLNYLNKVISTSILFKSYGDNYGVMSCCVILFYITCICIYCMENSYPFALHRC